MTDDEIILRSIHLDLDLAAELASRCKWPDGDRDLVIKLARLIGEERRWRLQP